MVYPPPATRQAEAPPAVERLPLSWASRFWWRVRWQVMPAPAASNDQVLIAFLPGISAGHAFQSLARVDAKLGWVDKAGGVWALIMDAPGAAWALYRSGAMLVTQSAIGQGCVSWSRTS